MRGGREAQQIENGLIRVVLEMMARPFVRWATPSVGSPLAEGFRHRPEHVLGAP